MLVYFIGFQIVISANFGPAVATGKTALGSGSQFATAGPDCWFPAGVTDHGVAFTGIQAIPREGKCASTDFSLRSK